MCFWFLFLSSDYLCFYIFGERVIVSSPMGVGDSLP